MSARIIVPNPVPVPQPGIVPDIDDLPPLPMLPPGRWVDPDSSDIEVLLEAPSHLRKVTNKNDPIPVVDSDDGDGAAAADLPAVRPSRSGFPGFGFSTPSRSRRGGSGGNGSTGNGGNSVTRSAGKKRSVQAVLSSDADEDEAGQRPRQRDPHRVAGPYRPRSFDLLDSSSDEGIAGPSRKRRNLSDVADRSGRVSILDKGERTMTITLDDDIEQVPLDWGGVRRPVDSDDDGPFYFTPSSGKRRRRVISPVSDTDQRDPLAVSTLGKLARDAVDLTTTDADIVASTSNPSRKPTSTSATPSHKPRISSPSPDPEPVGPIKPDWLLPLVLEILPDLDPTWALASLASEIDAGRSEGAIGHVVNLAMEMEGGYPKATTDTTSGKGKGKAKEGESCNGQDSSEKDKYRSVLFRKDRRTGLVYIVKAFAALEEAFPAIPIPHIRMTWDSLAHLYAPTYFQLLKDSRRDPRPYTELKRARFIKGKKRAREGDPLPLGSSQGVPATDDGEMEWKREEEWLQGVLEQERVEEVHRQDKAAKHARDLANGAGIECGCCFGEEVMAEMYQCAEGHLFCAECATKNAETKLGEQRVNITCMDTSGCPAPFPETELSRLLPAKSLLLYHRLKQALELEQAEIPGLETCPACPFAAVIENEGEKLFWCLNEECGRVTCRGCRREEHIPRSCEEVEADSKLDKRHAVEDAMSAALIRNCPRCKKAFVKEGGCNKIHCHNCGATSCYICRQLIQGYDHFDQNPADYGRPRVPSKCILWDRNESQTELAAIVAARDAAQNDVRAAARVEGIELRDADLHVDAPNAIAPPRRPGYALGLPYPHAHADPYHPLPLLGRGFQVAPHRPHQPALALPLAPAPAPEFQYAGGMQPQHGMGMNVPGLPPPAALPAVPVNAHPPAHWRDVLGLPAAQQVPPVPAHGMGPLQYGHGQLDHHLDYYGYDEYDDEDDEDDGYDDEDDEDDGYDDEDDGFYKR